MKISKLNSRGVNSNPHFTSDAWNAIDASIDKIFENNSDRNLSNVSIIGQALMASVAQYFDDIEDVMKALIDGIRSDNNVYWNSRSNNADIQVKTTGDKCISEWNPVVIKIAGVDYNAKGRVNIFYQSSANALRVADLEISWGSSSKLQKFLKSNGVNNFRNCETTLGISGYWGDGVKFNKEANQVFIDALSNGVLTFDTLEDFKKRDCKELNKYRFDKSGQRLVTNSRFNSRFRNSRRLNSVDRFIPKSSDDLKDFIETYCEDHGWDADLNFIDVSKITDMSLLFENSEFNGDISRWDVSNVTNMNSMFEGSQFNGDISKWNVGKVKSMYGMFSNSQFNGDISKWNVGNVTDMEGMFFQSQFNGDISKWNVSKVEDMGSMFANSPFDGDISKWNVGNVTNMSSMFAGSAFDGDLSKWNVSKVTIMNSMFADSQFNGDISKWNVSKVIDMDYMFEESVFDGDISNWKVGKRTSRLNIFHDCPLEGSESMWD